MTEQPPSAQAAQPKRKPMGRARVKPRHLSHILRQAIVDQFGAVQSSEDVAESLGIPVRTVTDVLLLNLRRSFTPERGRPEPYMLRKSA